MWIGFVITSRPKSKVTTLLVVGLSFLFYAMLFDFIDELFKFDNPQHWIFRLEATPAPIGMILITIGLYHWGKEELAVNEQLKRRERFYRDNALTDYVTQLYSADYMRQQINYELEHRTSTEAPFSILLMDLDQFDHFNRQHGDADGDRLLREIADITVMNLRNTDLACRYAGDRFIVLLPNTAQAEAEQLAAQVCDSVAHLAFKTSKKGESVYNSITAVAIQANAVDSVQSITERANQQLEQAKNKRS